MPKPSLKDAILDAGLKAMFRTGYHGTSVRDITAAAGVPQGSFTNHFRSKEVASEVLDRRLDRRHRGGLPHQAGGLNKLRRIIMADVSIIYCRPCGYEKRAKEAAAALRKQLAVEAKLVAGSGGIFEVKVGDRIVAKRTKEHFPDATGIVKAVGAVRS
jgi:selT/selW/selH-like putative selenoprotein